MPALIGFVSAARSRHSAAVSRWPNPVKRRPRSLVISPGPGEYLQSARPSRNPRRLSPNQRRQLRLRISLPRIRRRKHHRHDPRGPDRQDRLPEIRAGGPRPLARNQRRQKRKLPRLKRKNKRKQPAREKRSPP